MCQTVHGGQHNAEAVEQRYADTELVILCKAHVLAREVAVVGNTVVRQHHTLGEACRSTGVLHVTHIMTGHLALHLEQRLIFDILTKQQEFGCVEHTAILLHTYIYYVLQIWEAFAVQMTAFAGLQFRQHRVGHVHVVTVPCTISDTQGMHIGVLTQIFKLVLLVVGVHRYQHGTDLGCGVKEREPVGHISGPDTHVGTTLNTNGDKTLGQIVHTLVELTPCKAKVTVGIHDVFLVGCGFCPILEPLSQGLLMKRITSRTSLCGVCSIWQWSASHV